jgi:uncharacterized protein YebE (UPF0316 family)
MLESLGPAILIFCLRCVDVSLGTLRMILTIQGRRTWSTMLGFVEVTVFITAVASVVRGPLDPLRILAYGGGFAAGTFLGMTLDRHLGLGDAVVRIISKSHKQLLAALTAAGFGVTLVDGRGGRGSAVGIVFSVCRRSRLREMMEMVRHIDRSAIVTVQEVRTQVHGFFSPKRPTPVGAIRGPVAGTQ